MLQNLLDEIDRLRKRRKFTVDKLNNLPSHCSGFYWLYTSYTLNELRICTPSSKTNSVNIRDLTRKHANYTHVCNEYITESNVRFLLVYNGIGGINKPVTPNSGGLKERIRCEFGVGSNGTGSLAISDTSLNDLSKWRFSYVTMYNNNNPYESNYDLDERWDYENYKDDIERIWRLKNGFPLLCRR